MSEIFVDTIKNKAGSTSLDSDKLPDMYSGSAKAWLKSDYSSGTPTIQNSLNISSIGDTAVGKRLTTFTNSMAGANDYAVSGAADTKARVNYTSDDMTATNFEAKTYGIYSPDNFEDIACHLTVDGDLA